MKKTAQCVAITGGMLSDEVVRGMARGFSRQLGVEVYIVRSGGGVIHLNPSTDVNLPDLQEMVRKSVNGSVATVALAPALIQPRTTAMQFPGVSPERMEHYRDPGAIKRKGVR